MSAPVPPREPSQPKALAVAPPLLRPPPPPLLPAARVEGPSSDGNYSRGPLLLFPDTSAVLAMLEAHSDTPG